MQHPNRLRPLLWVTLFLTLVTLIGASARVQPVAAQSDAGKVYLPLVIGDGEGPEGPSSIQLIEQARAAGTITDEQALIYKVQAVVGDPALPRPYQGDDRDQDGTLVMNAALEQWDALSPATQATLAPYLRAPSQPDSWIALN